MEAGAGFTVGSQARYANETVALSPFATWSPLSSSQENNKTSFHLRKRMDGSTA